VPISLCLLKAITLPPVPLIAFFTLNWGWQLYPVLIVMTPVCLGGVPLKVCITGGCDDRGTLGSSWEPIVSLNKIEEDS
jgi:hypothetical protein